MSEQLDDFTHSVEREALPAPPRAPGDFLVRIEEGWGGEQAATGGTSTPSEADQTAPSSQDFRGHPGMARLGTPR